MNENNEMVQQKNAVDNETVVQATPSAQPAAVRDPRNIGQYAIDKTFDAAGRELDRLEKEKPGTRRKLAGITSIALGAGGIGTGIYLLVS